LTGATGRESENSFSGRNSSVWGMADGHFYQRVLSMAIAEKINGFISQASFIRKMFEEGGRLKERYGAENVFDFSLGNPNVEPPREFVERLRRLAYAEIPGMHMYMPNAGYPETRAAVAEAVSSSRGVPLTADQIVKPPSRFSLTNRTFVLHYGGMIFSEEKDRVPSCRCLSPPESPVIRLLPLRGGLFRDICPNL